MSKIGRKALCQLKSSIYHHSPDKPVTRRKTSALWGLLVAGGVGMGMAPTGSAMAASTCTTAGTNPEVQNCTGSWPSGGFTNISNAETQNVVINFGSGIVFNNGSFSALTLSLDTLVDLSFNLATSGVISVTSAADGTEHGIRLISGDDVTFNINGTIDAALTSAGDGINSNGTNNLTINVKGAGSVLGRDDGIEVIGATTVNISNTGSGHIEGDLGTGIDINSVGSVTIPNSSPLSIVGAVDGINISTATSATVDNDGGSITGTIGDGIDFNAITGPANVSNIGGAILGGDNGIEATSVGTTAGTGLSVLNKSGDITGTFGDGIQVTHNDGDLNITNISGGSIKGGDTGIDINTVHMGNVTIDNTGGTIDGGAAGFGINVADVTGSDVTIDNMGGLISGGTGIGVTDIDGAFLLSNTSGTVTGTAGDGVSLGGIGTTVTIKNTGGLIAGTDEGIVVGTTTTTAPSVAGLLTINNGLGSITGVHGHRSRHFRGHRRWHPFKRKQWRYCYYQCRRHHLGGS